MRTLHGLFSGFVLAIVLAACGNQETARLSKEERSLVMGSDSLMRVLTVFDKEDSLVLRARWG